LNPALRLKSDMTVDEPALERRKQELLLSRLAFFGEAGDD